MFEALMFGHNAIKLLCAFEKKIAKEVGKEKRTLHIYKIDEELVNYCLNYVSEVQKKTHKERLIEACSIKDKLKRQNTIDELEKEVIDIYDAKDYKTPLLHDVTVNEVKEVFEGVVREEVRRLITIDKFRFDGRKLTEIRPLVTQYHFYQELMVQLYLLEVKLKFFLFVLYDL